MRPITFPSTPEFGFTVTDSSGSATDATNVVVHVRKHGTAVGAAPMYSVSAELLSHANWPPGHYYVPVAVTTANGFSADFEYTVYARASVGGAETANVVGEFKTEALVSAGGLSTIFQSAMTNLGVLSSAGASAIMAGVLANYDTPTSADVSAIAVQVLNDKGISSVGAILDLSAAEPTSAPEWGSMTHRAGMEWTYFRGLNRHDQTTTKIEIFSSAGTAVVSASVNDDGSTAKREQFLG